MWVHAAFVSASYNHDAGRAVTSADADCSDAECQQESKAERPAAVHKAVHLQTVGAMTRLQCCLHALLTTATVFRRLMVSWCYNTLQRHGVLQ